MYNDLFEQDEFVQKQRELGHELGWEEGREKGRAEGGEEGRELGRKEGIKAAQEILIELVKIRYPSLVDLAEDKAKRVDNLGVLKEVMKIIVTTLREETAHDVLAA